MEKDAKTVTIGDVAEALGVSKTTVSRAISGKGRIGENTRKRVLDYIEKCDYKPSVIARGLAQSKTFNICVVMPEDYNLSDLPFFHQVMIGIQEIAGQMDYDILLCIGKEEDCSGLERILTNRKVDGVILLRTYIHDIQIELLQSRQIPFVTVGSTDYSGVFQVDHDQQSACQELTSLLLTKKSREIALLGGRDSLMITRNRLQGFLNAYEKMNMKPQECLIYLNLETRPAVDRAVEEVLKQNADCMICMDDVICSQVLQKLRQEHRNIPQDMRVASFYNSWVLENNVPAITALSFDARKLGMEACRTLFRVVNGEEQVLRRILPFQMLLKDSTKEV